MILPASVMSLEISLLTNYKEEWRAHKIQLGITVYGAEKRD